MDPQPKKKYQTPSLAVYGDLRRLTQSKGASSNDGGGAKPSTKTGGAPA